MERFEIARLTILTVSWPVLIMGSIWLALHAKRFYEDVGRSSFGRLVAVLVAGLLVTMYGLTVVATAFMVLNPREGVPIVVPVFVGWFMLMALVTVSLGGWTKEAAAVNAVHAKLAEANRVRTDLINRASHELGTPLTPLLIQASLLRDPELGPLTSQQLRAVDIIERNLQRLASLVREMMDVSRLQSGHLELVRTEVDLSEILREAVESFNPAAREAGLGFEHRIDPGLRVEADPNRIAQIMQSLLDNAIQFTAQGGRVRVVARRLDGAAEILVEDTGIGFRPADAPRLFQPFLQLDPARARKGSVGLGLFIAQSIVQAHGGHIWARSAGPGQGASFLFSLPLLPASRAVPTTTRVHSTGAPQGQ